jgi:DNA-directed RNA polymerase subunit M/transcription elongation factor TFIIS
MEDKCPKCGETLLTKTIQKKIGSGSIDYPIAATCPKCKWSKDLTGAGDIASKPVMADAGAARKEEAKTEIKTKVQTVAPSKPAPSPRGINALIPIVLAILVLGAIAWVFFINPSQKEQVVTTPTPTPVPTPVVTQTPVRTPASTPARKSPLQANSYQ